MINDPASMLAANSLARRSHAWTIRAARPPPFTRARPQAIAHCAGDKLAPPIKLRATCSDRRMRRRDNALRALGECSVNEGVHKARHGLRNCFMATLRSLPAAKRLLLAASDCSTDTWATYSTDLGKRHRAWSAGIQEHG